MRKINNVSDSGQETSDEESEIEELEHRTEEEHNSNQMLIFYIFGIFQPPFVEGKFNICNLLCFIFF